MPKSRLGELQADTHLLQLASQSSPASLETQIYLVEAQVMRQSLPSPASRAEAGESGEVRGLTAGRGLAGATSGLVVAGMLKRPWMIGVAPINPGRLKKTARVASRRMAPAWRGAG